MHHHKLPTHQSIRIINKDISQLPHYSQKLETRLILAGQVMMSIFSTQKPVTEIYNPLPASLTQGVTLQGFLIMQNYCDKLGFVA